MLSISCKSAFKEIRKLVAASCTDDEDASLGIHSKR